MLPPLPQPNPFAWNKARLRSRHPLELSPRNTHPNPAGLWASKPSETSRSRRSVESSPLPQPNPFAWNKARPRPRRPIELSPRNTHPNPTGLWASKPSETSPQPPIPL